jgi:hypothetical protein
MVRLLFDQNLSPRLVTVLADVFPGSTHVRDVGLSSANDEEVWAYAIEHELAIVSKDSDYHGEIHLWTHVRVKRGKRQTVASHLPEHRGDLRRRSRSYWHSKASAMGEDCRRLAEAIFDTDDVLPRLGCRAGRGGSNHALGVALLCRTKPRLFQPPTADFSSCPRPRFPGAPAAVPNAPGGSPLPK